MFAKLKNPNRRRDVVAFEGGVEVAKIAAHAATFAETVLGASEGCFR
jgi:hypothetical protein